MVPREPGNLPLPMILGQAGFILVLGTKNVVAIWAYGDVDQKGQAGNVWAFPGYTQWCWGDGGYTVPGTKLGFLHMQITVL